MAVKKTASLAEQLRALAEAAPAMRKAGITGATIDGVSVTLAPPDAEPPKDDRPGPAPDVMFGDPDSFFGPGRKAGAS